MRVKLFLFIQLISGYYSFFRPLIPLIRDQHSIRNPPLNFNLNPTKHNRDKHSKFRHLLFGETVTNGNSLASLPLTPKNFQTFSTNLNITKTQTSNVNNDGEVVGECRIKLVSFNILAPCYKRLTPPRLVNDKKLRYESEIEVEYLNRNIEIINQLKNSNADIICIQEFWCGNLEIKKLYTDLLCSPDNEYDLQELRRTSHWRMRDDGLAVFVKRSRIILQDIRDIRFHDCGDRVAQMLLLSVKPEIEKSQKEKIEIPYQQFICVNTHLLFPHNKYSSNIRLREMTKILGFIEAYRQRELCSTICGRSDVRVPVIIAGDFNGGPRGAVYKYIKSQNFQSAFEEVGKSKISFDHDHPIGRIEYSWISHMSHLEKAVAVDHIFFSNPSSQIESQLPPIPDWTNLVYRELINRLVSKYGEFITMGEVFAKFDVDGSSFVTREKFRNALAMLGFSGEGEAALTPDEIDILIDSADKNGDGSIDYKEFYDRFWMAANADTESRSNRIEKKKSFFARSSWLARDLTPLVVASPAAAGPEDESSPLDVNSDASDTSSLQLASLTGAATALGLTYVQPATINTNTLMRPLGDLRVESLKIIPEIMETGIWPEDYNLSDHGMIECVFIGNAMGPDPDPIDPAPFAQGKKEK